MNQCIECGAEPVFVIKRGLCRKCYNRWSSRRHNLKNKDAREKASLLDEMAVHILKKTYELERTSHE